VKEIEWFPLNFIVKDTVVASKSKVENDVIILRDLFWSEIEYTLHYVSLAAKNTN